MTARDRKRLLAEANRLPVSISVTPGAIDDAVVAHIMMAFSKHALLKLRINTQDRDECMATAAELAERSGGALVQVIGRVCVLFRAPHAESAERASDD